MTRAETRRQDKIHKEKAKRLLKEIKHEYELAEDPRIVGIEADSHSCRCSCSLCRTSRKNPWAKTEKLSIQERRKNQEDHDEEQ